MQLRLLVADFYLDPSEVTPERVAQLPRLPALERLLRLGSGRPAPPDWRRALAEALGVGALGEAPVAQIAARALPLAPRDPWIAAPVHLQAGLDHLRLHRAGLLQLTPGEREQLCEQFGRSFKDSGLALHALASGLVLSGLPASETDTRDPAAHAGADLRAAALRGPDAALLRRVGSEIEMWLHDQPLNVARARRGQLAVNGLWLWGGGPPTPVPKAAAASPLRLYAEDPYVEGLAHVAGVQAQQVPQQFSDVGVSPEAGECVVVLSCAARDARDAPLARLEERWFEPVARALATGQLRTARLYCAGKCWSVAARAGWRPWRRIRPWWEVLAR